MYRLLLAIGVAIQVLAMLGTKIDTPLSWQAGWLALSFTSLVGIAFVVAAGIKAGPKPVFRTFAFAGSLAGMIGWASWILVTLFEEKGDPVINITGLLCVVGWALTACAVATAVVAGFGGKDESRRTWAWLFALLIFANEAFFYVFYIDPSDPARLEVFWLTLLAPIVIGATQIAMGLRSRTKSIAKPLSIASGVFLLAPFSPALLALLCSIVAAVVEFNSADMNAAFNETIEE